MNHNPSVPSARPEWVLLVDEEIGWGPAGTFVLENGREVDVNLLHDPETGVSIHVGGVHGDDPLTVADARHLASALLDLADIADPGKLATQKLRDLIDASRSGLAGADDLDAALTELENGIGLPVTFTREEDVLTDIEDEIGYLRNMGNG